MKTFELTEQEQNTIINLCLDEIDNCKSIIKTLEKTNKEKYEDEINTLLKDGQRVYLKNEDNCDCGEGELCSDCKCLK